MRTPAVLLRVALCLAVVAGAVAVPAPALAASVVYVEDHTGSAWPVNAAQDFVDRYTGSDIRYGRCRAGYRCVRVYEKTVRSDWAAVTVMSNPPVIYVNPQRNGYPYAARRGIITHELGHAFGITYHSAYCTNIMWPKVFCPNGSVPSYRFTDPQKAILRSH